MLRDGITKMKSGKFRADRKVLGKSTLVGVYPTYDEAHNALKDFVATPPKVINNNLYVPKKT